MASNNKARTSIIKNAFEDVFELGKSTVRETGKALESTFNPLHETKPNAADKAQKELDKKGTHTPLDFEKLKRKFANEDEAKQEAIRNRLHQMVKNEEKETHEKSKQVNEQKKYDELKEAEDKKQARIQQQQQASMSSVPQGKVKQSILAPKKRVVQQEHQEFKPATGKS